MQYRLVARVVRGGWRHQQKLRHSLGKPECKSPGTGPQTKTRGAEATSKVTWQGEGNNGFKFCSALLCNRGKVMVGTQGKEKARQEKSSPF